MSNYRYLQIDQPTSFDKPREQADWRSEKSSVKGGTLIEFTPLSGVKGSGPAVQRPTGGIKSQRPARILIVEDNVDGNETLSFCLKLEGYEVDSAFDGGQGLAMAKNGCYDVICCDIGLPVMNGYEVLEQVRLHCVDPMPYCIAMTGYDQLKYPDRAGQMEFDHFLIKPVSIDRLVKIIVQIRQSLSSPIGWN